MRELPLFPVTTVGSWPRSPEVLRAQRRLAHGGISEEEFDRVADEAVLHLLAIQEAAGVDVVTDGEQRRDSFYSFVAGRLDGVRLLSLAEMLDVVEDKAGFERILQTLDVPAFAIHNPTCTGPIARRRPLAVEEARFLRRHTDRPIKVPLPGPYLLTRAMWVKELTRAVYDSKEALAEDVVRVLGEECRELRDAGVDFIQLDEPVLTELVFTQGRTLTFMCAALAARQDPEEELELAVDLVNRVVDGLDGVRVGLHVCRGNWSRREETLLAGSYAPLAPTFARLRVRQLVLEFATPRAGDLAALFGGASAAGGREGGKELGLGVVNPRTDEVESPGRIAARVEEALAYLPPERIFLNPDCGFGTFASRPMNAEDVATAKLRAMAEAARALRRRHAGRISM